MPRWLEFLCYSRCLQRLGVQPFSLMLNGFLLGCGASSLTPNSKVRFILLLVQVIVITNFVFILHIQPTKSSVGESQTRETGTKNRSRRDTRHINEMISDSRQRYNKFALTRNHNVLMGWENSGLTMRGINNFVAQCQNLVTGLLHISDISYSNTWCPSRMSECGSRSGVWTA